MTDASPPATLAAAPSGPDAAAASAPLPPSQPVARLRWISLALLLGLVLLCVGWELWWAPTGSGTLALKALPLVLCLPGLWLHRMYTYRSLSLLLWLYFTEGTVRATSEGGLGQQLAALEVLLALALFTSCTLYIRRRLRDGQARQAALAGRPSAH
jgi:uncharacterized membrane protein